MSRKYLVLSSIVLVLGLLAVPSLAAEKVLLHYAYKVGDKYVTTMTQHSDITQQAGTNSVDVKQDVSMDMGIEVLAVDPKGVAELKYTYQRVALKQDSPAGSIDYDSGDPAKKDVASPAIMGYKALVGQAITVHVAPNGEVKDAKGFEKIAEAIIAQGPEGDQREAARVQIGKMFNEERFNQQMAGLSVQFPDKPVAVGDSWHRDQKTDMGFINLVIKSDYKVAKLTPDSVEISLAGTIASGPKPEGELPISATIGDKSTQSGAITVNRANPALMTSTMSQSLNITMSARGQSVNQSVVSTVKVATKLVEK